MEKVADSTIEQIAELTKDLIEADSFLVAILAESEHDMSGLCPHCNSDNQPIVLEECMNISNHIADLYLCTDCVQVFILVSYPTLYDTYHPVFLQFFMKPGENAVAEVVATDMAKAIMAQAEASKMEVID